MWIGIIIGVTVVIIYKILFTTKSNKNKLLPVSKKIDFTRYINSKDKNAIVELNQLYNFFPNGLNSKERPFWMSNDNLCPIIVDAMICYSFDVNINNIAPLIRKGNNFLKEVSSGTDYWDSIKKFSKKDFKDSISNDLTIELKKYLTSLSLIDRIILVEFLSVVGSYEHMPSLSLRNQREQIILDIKRKFKKNSLIGSTEPKYNLLENSSSLHELISPILESKDETDYFILPNIVSRGEMREYAENLGYEIKKSWNAEKVVTFMSATDKGKEDLRNYLKKLETKTILNFSKYRVEVSKQKNEIKRLFELLCNI